MIRCSCPKCGSVLSAPDKRAGRNPPCPKCGQLLRLPGAMQAAPVAPAPALDMGSVVDWSAMQGPAAPRPGRQDSAARPPPAPVVLDELEEIPARRCPFCAEPINAEAMKCRHCGELLDPDMRAAKAEAEGQADGVGLIAITLAALALIGTIAGMLCFGYGTLVGVPIALAGLVVAIFAGKKRKAALILNSGALVPPVVLGVLVFLAMTFFGVSFTMCCCGGLGGSHVTPDAGGGGSPPPGRRY